MITEDIFRSGCVVVLITQPHIDLYVIIICGVFHGVGFFGNKICFDHRKQTVCSLSCKHSWPEKICPLWNLRYASAYYTFDWGFGDLIRRAFVDKRWLGREVRMRLKIAFAIAIATLRRHHHQRFLICFRRDVVIVIAMIIAMSS